MSRAHIAVMTSLVCVALALPAQAQTPPTFATTKVDGTDNVYIFRMTPAPRLRICRIYRLR